MANNIANFVRRKPGIRDQRHIMQPEFSFFVACANVNVGRLVAFIRVEEGAIWSPA